MNNRIHVDFYIRKRDSSEFKDEQSKEISERIQSAIEQLGYVIEVKSNKVEP